MLPPWQTTAQEERPLPTASSTREAKASRAAEAECWGGSPPLGSPLPHRNQSNFGNRVVLQLFIGLALKSSKITFPQIGNRVILRPGEQNLCRLAAAEHGASIDPFHRRDGHSLGLSRPWAEGPSVNRCPRPAADCPGSRRGAAGEPSSPLPLDGLGEPAVYPHHRLRLPGQGAEDPSGFLPPSPFKRVDGDQAAADFIGDDNPGIGPL